MTKKRKSPRRYNPRTLKILWGRAAGRCAVPECRIEVLVDANDYDPTVVIGDIAHIEASSDKGPRGTRRISANERDQYDNLILLCKNCHAKLDGLKNTNPAEAIKQLRRNHEAWVRASLPERGRSLTGWSVLILQGEHPIDSGQVEAAFAPDYPSGTPTVFSVPPAKPWPETFADLTKAVQGFLGQRDAFDCRFAVFPLAPVSACLAAGYLLTNRPRVRLFQHHRTSGAWAWAKDPGKVDGLRVKGLPAKPVTKRGEVAVCFHLSARISRADIPVPKNSLLRVTDIAVPDPSIHWLKSPEQLDSLGKAAGNVFEALLLCCPNATRWHIFFAGPAPGAVKVGQQLNPTMIPPTQLYEFNRSSSPKYRTSILLNASHL